MSHYNDGDPFVMNDNRPGWNRRPPALPERDPEDVARDREEELPPNHCDECGQDFYYEPKLHECKHKGRQHVVTTTWVEECMAKQNGTTP